MQHMGLMPVYHDGDGLVVDVDGWDDGWGDEYGRAGRGRRRRQGRRKRRARKQYARRTARADRRFDARMDRIASRDYADPDGEDPEGPLPSRSTGWSRTTIGGSATAAAAGSFQITFVSQTDFEALDLKAAGTAGVQISSVQFGDQIIWQSNVGGLDISLFSPDGGFRGLLEGRKIGVGSTVTINAIAGAAADTLSVAIDGLKPVGGTC